MMINPASGNQDSVKGEASLFGKIQDLPDFIFHSNKLRSTDIIDSILHYESGNYYYPECFNGTISGFLTNGDDSLFHAVSDSVYFCRRNGKNQSYQPRIKPRNRPEVEGKQLSRNASLRIRNVQRYLPECSFSSIVGKLKENIIKNGDLFGISYQNGKRLHHILIRESQTNNNGPGIGFVHLTIESEHWKLLEAAIYRFGTNDSFLNTLKAVRSCKQAIELIETEVAKPDKTVFCGISSYKFNAAEKLIPASFIMRDNLYYAPGDTDQPNVINDGTIYVYQVLFEESLTDKPKGSLVKFDVYQWLQHLKSH